MPLIVGLVCLFVACVILAVCALADDMMGPALVFTVCVIAIAAAMPHVVDKYFDQRYIDRCRDRGGVYYPYGVILPYEDTTITIRSAACVVYPEEGA